MTTTARDRRRANTVSIFQHMVTCADCDFRVDARNAMALAARHHYRTGHQVTAEVGYLWRRDAP